MLEIMAKPSNSLLLKPTKARLTLTLQDQLKVFKKYPTPTEKVEFSRRINSLLEASISRIMLEGYSQGAVNVGELEDNGIRLLLKRLAKQQALEATKQIVGTSAISLGLEAAMSSKRVASKDRASFISEDQLFRSYFLGVRYGWALFPGAAKRWYVSDAHDVDDICNDNEDVGTIPIGTPFPSGHMQPTAHLGCTCFMILVKGKKK